MNIPTFLHGTNEQNQAFFEELFQTLLQGLSNNGWTVPNLSTADITSVEPSMPLGTIWYNTNLNKLQVKTSGGVETITSV